MPYCLCVCVCIARIYSRFIFHFSIKFHYYGCKFHFILSHSTFPALFAMSLWSWMVGRQKVIFKLQSYTQIAHIQCICMQIFVWMSREWTTEKMATEKRARERQRRRIRSQHTNVPCQFLQSWQTEFCRKVLRWIYFNIIFEPFSFSTNFPHISLQEFIHDPKRMKKKVVGIVRQTTCK